MSDPKLEAVEAETNITPPTGDAAVKAEIDAAPAPKKVEEVKAESKDTEMNGGVKEEDVKGEEKDEKKVRTYDNGILKTTRRADESGDFKKNSKYDPSILPETDDGAEIRKQVWSYMDSCGLSHH
jgi:lupus La protein